MTNQPKFSGYFQAFLAALMTFTCGMSAFIRQWFIDKRESILGVAIACIGFGGAAGTWLFGVLLLYIGAKELFTKRKNPGTAPKPSSSNRVTRENHGGSPPRNP